MEAYLKECLNTWSAFVQPDGLHDNAGPKGVPRRKKQEAAANRGEASRYRQTQKKVPEEPVLQLGAKLKQPK